MSPVLFYILIGFLILGAVTTVAMIGKPRKPLEPGVAALSLLINITLIVSMFIWRYYP